MDSGKDSAFNKFESPCSQCAKGVTLENGVSLKNAGKRKVKSVYTEEDLFHLYQKFEKNRIEKAEKQLGNGIRLKPDSFAKFVVERTDLCPHRLISPNSSYWVDTALLVDGEMGLVLPDKMSECPAVFFDALGIVRSARAQVRKEETKG